MIGPEAVQDIFPPIPTSENGCIFGYIVGIFSEDIPGHEGGGVSGAVFSFSPKVLPCGVHGRKKENYP